MTDPQVPEAINTAVTTTETDGAEVLARIAEPFRARIGDPAAELLDPHRSSASGMSSVSVMFRLRSRGAEHPLVLRLAPEQTAVPVFPRYDLALQAAVGEALAAAGQVPVPRVWWTQTDPGLLGRPFLVMDLAPGSAPQDNPPYVFAGPLVSAGPARLAAIERASVDMLAGVHATPLGDELRAVLGVAPGDDGLGLLLADTADYYRWIVDSGAPPVPLIERGLERLAATRPADSGEQVLTWGDARIGNILYTDDRPSAVLDFESATIGPPEFDVAWFVFFHRMYQDLAAANGRAGLPGFLRPDAVIDRYQRRTGRVLADMEFHLLHAAVRCAVIFARIKQRTVHFGDTAAPSTPDEYVLHHRLLGRALTDPRDAWEL